MGQKKTNIKIKHRKFNLYNKKKSKAKQALTIILTIVAACALGVVGYGIGKPVMDFIRGNSQYTSGESSDNSGGADSSGENNSADVSDISDAVSGDSSGAQNSPGGSQTTSGNNSVPPVEATNGTMYFLPDNAATSSASLNSAIAAAKNTGHTTVAVTMKDNSGFFLYKSNIAGIKDTDSITGTLTAQQICEIITKAGLTPAAKINTVMDKKNGNAIGGNYTIVGGGNWLDNRPEKGGKLWLSPFKTNTVQFAGNIAEELSAAGFKHIICVNTMYPRFHNIDVSTYLSDLPLNDSSKRTAALWNVLDSVRSGAEKNGAKLWIEVTGENLLNEKKNSTDAELCLDSAKTKNAKLILDYSSSGSPNDAYKNAKDFAEKAKSAAGGAEISVLLKGFAGSALNDVHRAFKEADIPVFTQ